MFISLDSVVEAARRRLAALTPEVAAYVVLLAARRLEARPSRVSWSGILLTDGGDVQCSLDSAAPELEVEAALRGVLQTLLELSPSPVPAISAVAQGSSAGSLSTFAHELSAALIPINHAAAQRALARLYRETLRARGPELEMARELTAEPPPVAPIAAADGSNELDIEVDLEAELALDAPLVTPERVPPVEPIAVGVPAPPEPPIATRAAVRVAELPELSPPATAEREIAAVPAPAEPEIAAPPTHGATGGPSERRSDVRELLLEFLAEARSDERKMRMLRAMIGIDEGSPPTSDEEPSAI